VKNALNVAAFLSFGRYFFAKCGNLRDGAREIDFFAIKMSHTSENCTKCSWISELWPLFF
jgi:hypothetical protein